MPSSTSGSGEDSNSKDRPSAAVRIRALKRDRYTCTYCGATGADVELEIDHIVPVSKGGSNHLSNLTTACKQCNLGKGDDESVVPPRAQKSHRSENRHGLVGLFFHTFSNNDPVRGELDWQGMVRSVDGDLVLVQLFSWLDGRPTVIKAMQKADLIARARLFASEDEWRSAAYRSGSARSRAQ